MGTKSQFQNAKYLITDQYRDSRNLGARAQLHERYASNSQGWFDWVMDFVPLQAGDRILECGCGPGWLWRSNLKRIAKDCRITLTDLSPGMVAEAEAALSTSGFDFRFFEADIAELPFEEQEYDVVVANHMLYHVPDRKKALAEVQRVLKKEGWFIAATVGKDHMFEIEDLRKQLFSEFALAQEQASSTFSLENGYSQLASWFRQVRLLRYNNHLLVTDVDHLLSYILSSLPAEKEIDSLRLKLASQTIQRSINEYGFYRISTDSGLFLATNNDESH